MFLLAVATVEAKDPGGGLADRLAERATQPDVTLVPPIGEPSPKAGSFLVAYEVPVGATPDPARVGTYDVAPSSCSEALVFETVPATESREELWLVQSGIGMRLGLPQLGLSASFGQKSLAGISYVVTEKLVVTGGLEELEACCLRSPEKCTDRYVSEYWRGTGKISRLTADDAGLKASVRGLEQAGKIDFANTRGWSMASTWDQPMYFAYRVQGFQAPSCQSYMNDLPDLPNKVLFTGVSRRLASEQQAREDARSDARMQVVKYLGEELKIEGDRVVASAEAVVSGVKDSLVCLDPVAATPEGPSYLARVRMYVDREKLDVAMAEIRSAKK